LLQSQVGQDAPSWHQQMPHTLHRHSNAAFAAILLLLLSLLHVMQPQVGQTSPSWHQQMRQPHHSLIITSSCCDLALTAATAACDATAGWANGAKVAPADAAAGAPAAAAAGSPVGQKQQQQQQPRQAAGLKVDSREPAAGFDEPAIPGGVPGSIQE
jgi:fructose-1,6-bisphosphatase/inositol monophosphatase family enzyme